MTEKDEQIALFDWAQYRTDLQRMFHITNEGRRSVQHTMSLLRQGMKPGVPDNMLPLARGGYHGLFIELKRLDGGTVSQAQRAWVKRLTDENYCAFVARGWEEAARTIRTYLQLGA